jgi:hypothetical protein
MVRAFGFCNDVFDTGSPGRLCRGRERWIEGLPDAPRVRLARTVCSGAVFSDDSARDARRGFAFSGVNGGTLLESLFPGESLHAFCEAGDPLALPPTMLLEEDWTRPLHGGQRSAPAVRWIAPARSEDVDPWIAGERDGLACPRADGFVIGARAVDEPLADALFRLVGFSEPDVVPATKYCTEGIGAVLEHARAVVLLHLDKHGPTVAIYAKDPLESDGILDLTARAAGAFPVPFAIPPMLARWDRALYELRMDWDAEQDGDFPVPPADDAGGRWSARRRQLEEEEREVPGEEGAGEE